MTYCTENSCGPVSPRWLPLIMPSSVSVCLSPLESRVCFSPPFKSTSELVMCSINRIWHHGCPELLRTGHKKPCCFHPSPLRCLLLGHSHWNQPPIKKSNNHETVILCEVQATWKGSGTWDATQRKREAKTKYMREEAILEGGPPVPATAVDLMWI